MKCHEVLRALAVLCEAPAPGHERVAAALGLERAPRAEEWAELFLFELPPYASIYLGAEGMIGGEALDRVAGFWRAVGLEPPAEPDHLAALLGLAAALEGPRAAHPLQALVAEHLAPWLPVYLDRVDELAPPPYRRWAELLRRALPPADGESLHLREAPPPLAAADGELLAALLAPVRSGVVLTRSDLVRASRELGIGLRIGERRFVLRALLGQDPAGMLGWLAAEARRASARHAQPFWRDRAAATAGVLAELAAEPALR